MSAKTAFVIGAGIGGLSAAVHLARAGFRVTVIEKNGLPGGRCNRRDRDGHRFDTGPTLFVMPLLYEAEFRAMGSSMREQLDLQRVDPTYHLVFDDGSRLALTSDLAFLREQLETLEGGSFDSLLRYLEEGGRHYRLVQDRLVNREFRSLFDLVHPRNLDLLLGLKVLVNHYRNMSAYFRLPRLKAAFTFQDVYMGLSPFEAPATYSMMPFSELAHGVWHPRGGMYRVAESLAELARRGGAEFLFHAPVERIEVDGSRVRGVRLADGSRRAADVVVANADLPYVYRDLLPQDGTARTLARKRYSCSVISFFWGLDRTYEILQPHTLFLADDYRANFESIMRDLTLPANPTVYVHAPARLDPSMAPRGQDTLIVDVPVGHLSGNGDQDWNALRNEARRHVLRRLRTLGAADIEAHIKFEESFTPLSWAERYNLVKGSTHGLAHTLTQMACFRPSNRHPRYRNLYFVGASTHPGTGMPTAMVSGRLTASRIAAENG
jgi:phytoene desaturase (3,4-didehydrolycopene-forming)